MIRNPIDEIINDTKRVIALLEDELASYGHLHDKTVNIVNTSNTRIYIHDKTGQHYVRQADWQQKASPIVRRDFVARLLESEKKKLQLLEQIGKLPDAEEIAASLDPIRRQLLPSTDVVSEKYAKEWLANRNSHYPAWPDSHPFTSERGERVRSKNEVIISNHMLLRSVLYLYEYPLKTDGRTTRYPDFIVLNRRTGKQYVYEHFGMMDDRRYQEENRAKLKEYAQLGFHVGENLVFTFETNGQQFDIKALDELIERYFT